MIDDLEQRFKELEHVENTAARLWFNGNLAHADSLRAQFFEIAMNLIRDYRTKATTPRHGRR